MATAHIHEGYTEDEITSMQEREAKYWNERQENPNIFCPIPSCLAEITLDNSSKDYKNYFLYVQSRTSGARPTCFNCFEKLEAARGE